MGNLQGVLRSSSSNIVCVRCRKPALAEEAVEKLPDGGTLIKAIHADGKECKWAEYDTIEDVMEDRNRVKNPRTIVCPDCSTTGRINHYYPNKMKKENVGYYIAHEQIEGYWGNNQKAKKYRRCYIRDSKQRDILLKELGRYIKPQFKQNGGKLEEVPRAPIKQDRRGQIQNRGPIIPKGKRLTICTKCNKPGYMYRTYFQHYNESPIGMVKLKGKEIRPNYRRCYFTKEITKADPELKLQANVLPVQKESENSTRDIVHESVKFIEASSSSLSKEDDVGKDYKKMYWDLINRPVSIADELSKLERLKDQGVITEEEFSQIKSNLMKKV